MRNTLYIFCNEFPVKWSRHFDRLRKQTYATSPSVAGCIFFTLTPDLWLRCTTQRHIFFFLFALCQLWPQAAQCFNLFPIGPKSKSVSVTLPAPTHKNWLEYDIIFQAELIVSGARFSLYGCVRTLLCYTMQPWLPGMALMKTYEELDASWLSREG